MSLAVSASGENAIHQDVVIDQESRDATWAINDFYEIDRTAEQIKTGQYKRVRLYPSLPTRSSELS
jgi:hypothetical protein